MDISTSQGHPWSGLSLSICACALAASSLGEHPSSETGDQLEATRHDLISDQLHSSGSRGFVFLPTMVPPPPDHGDIVPDLPVTVRIDELATNGTTARTLATFTKNTGPEGKHQRIHYQNGPCDPDDNDRDSDPAGYSMPAGSRTTPR